VEKVTPKSRKLKSKPDRVSEAIDLFPIYDLIISMAIQTFWLEILNAYRPILS
jgi:hypothetical protein